MHGLSSGEIVHRWFGNFFFFRRRNGNCYRTWFFSNYLTTDTVLQLSNCISWLKRYEIQTWMLVQQNAVTDNKRIGIQFQKHECFSGTDVPVLLTTCIKISCTLTTTQGSNFTTILTQCGQQNRIQDKNYCNTYSKTDDNHEPNADTFDIARADKLLESTQTETLSTRTVTWHNLIFWNRVLFKNTPAFHLVYHAKCCSGKPPYLYSLRAKSESSSKKRL